MDNDKEEKLKRQCSVRNLTIEQQAALDSYMIADHPVDKLVKIVQGEWKAFADSKPDAVRRMLFRYKSKHIKLKQAKLTAKFSSSQALQDLAADITKLEQRLDPVFTLEELVITQAARIKKMAKTEAKAPTLLESQTKNIGLMGDLLMKLTNAQLDTGLLRRVPRKLDIVAVDITEEERRFMETSKLSDARAGFLVDAMRALREGGLIDLETVEVKNGN